MKKLETSSATVKGPYFLLKSIQKAFAILEILCAEGETSISDLAKRTKLQKSNVHRLLATLTYLGYAEQNAVTNKYLPSLKTLGLGNAVINRSGLPQIAHLFLENLADQFRETANLALLDRGEVIYIDKVESSESLRMDIKIGSRVPAYCAALGKVLLANLSESEIKDFLKRNVFLPYTKRTVTSPEELRKTLIQIGIQGFAIDDEELYEGVRCIAAPIRNHVEKVIAAISIAGPSVRMSHDKLVQLREPIINTAKEISKKLGYPHRD